LVVAGNALTAHHALAQVAANLPTALPAALTTATINRETPPIRETIVSVSINKQPVAAAVAVLEVRGLGIVLPLEDFKSLRLDPAKTPIAIRRADEYVPLSRIESVTASINQRTLELEITAPAGLFGVTRLAMESRAIGPVTRPATGVFLNYDLLAFQSRQVKQLGGFFEGVFFTPYGSLVSNQLVNRFDDSSTRSTRLDTYWQSDFPDRLERLRVGDNISATGSWGRGVRYGGIKFGTDFSLSPYLLTLPQLNLGGSAAVPSTVDLYVNNALQRRFNVPPGPFSIDQIPVITGAGDARLVVRNALGQEQVIEVPFFRIPQQLKQGFSDYAVELGSLRNNYALTSNDYSGLVAASTWRYGLSNTLTSEVRGEWQRNGVRTAGLAAIVALGGGHSINPGVVASSDAAGNAASGASGGNGVSNVLGYAFAGRAFRFSSRIERNSRDFRQLGFGPLEVAVARRTFLSAGFRVANNIDVGLGYTDLVPRISERLQIGSLNLNARLSRAWSVSTVFSRVLSTPNSTSLSVSLSWAGDDLNYALAGHQSSRSSDQSNSNYSYARYAQRPDFNGGFGYEAELASDGRARLRAEALTSAGQYTVESARLANDQGSAQRATARGALIGADRSVRASRVIEDSFVMVKAPEVPGAKVSRSGGREFTLDASGRAVIERVQPYSETRVQVVANSLPIDTVIGKFENRVRVPSKAGVILDLAIKRVRSVTFRLITNGKPAPVGAVLEYAGLRNPVGIDGLVYIEEIGKGGEAIARVGSKSCILKVPAPLADEAIPDLGDLACSLN
jgi:outer membrane usher protein